MNAPATAVRHRLTAEGQSAARARRLVEQAVLDGGLSGLLDEALLLVTELVTNAVVHAGTEVELSVQATPEGLRVEVADRLRGSVPVMHEGPDPAREGGRGIFLLDALATEWGTRNYAGGKSIWFTLGLPTGAGPAGALPAPDVPPTPAPRSPPGAAPAYRRDLTWLTTLPARLEGRLKTDTIVRELLLRMCEAIDLPGVWLLQWRGQDEPASWLVAGEPAGPPPDPARVRRHCAAGDGTAPGVPGLEILPLRAGPDVVGALVLRAPVPADELALARLVALRVHLLVRDQQGHSTDLRHRGSLALLAEASELFATTFDVRLALTLAAQLVVRRFASWAATFTTYEHNPRPVAVAHRDESRLPVVREALTPAVAETVVARLGDRSGDHATLVPHSLLGQGLGPELAGDVLAVPLVARRRLLAVLLVGAPDTGSFEADDLSLLTDLCRQAALAVDNARLYEERSAVARALQASLLPPTLPVAEGVEFAARYAAAGEGNDVGGDFYDVFTLPDGGWGMAIGDVCGKGAEAASITGMARDVLRLLTRDGAEPPSVLRRLNEVILELGERGRFCTTQLATVHRSPEGLRVRLCSGGHPPPVLLAADGGADYVGRCGTVLGVVDTLELPCDELLLRPGDALVFYTDGVTERRSGRQMFGDDNLLATLQRRSGSTADQLAGALERDVRAFGSGPTRDDLAVLVLRAAPEQSPG